MCKRYAALLRRLCLLLPAHSRRLYADELADTYATMLREAADRGGPGNLRRMLLTLLADFALALACEYTDCWRSAAWSPARIGAVCLVAAAAILTPAAAFVAGGVTGIIARSRPVLHAVPMAAAIAIETTVLYRRGVVDGPLWFESIAAGSLIAAAILGAAVCGAQTRQGTRAVRQNRNCS